MSKQKIIIDPVFEGPPAWAHGGYACGVVARHVAGDAEVTLRRPVPLGSALRLSPQDGGVALHDGNTLVAEGATTTLTDDVPPPPSFAEALAATASFPGLRAHPYPRCVGCGTDRTDAVALRVFPGPLVGRDLVAAVWYPGEDATADGLISRAFAWAALDCPGGWAATHFGKVDRPAVLGRMAARLAPAIEAREAHLVVGWLEGVSGRKLTAGSALFSRDGVVQGVSRQTWVVSR
ncbi:hypothetical protein [Actinophytocola oryzae]|uniref:Thioesterase superfamily protein n=1 Tax=Actinophytocola oryzae TaxID=502181 RepID=A0A4R7W1W0_9PSEU|nr:hypothetical protein [Actinophytocola oryzae]TDV56412.1 hypothetical protein CLV71_102479 [Actinophytocola oryzae]